MTDSNTYEPPAFKFLIAKQLASFFEANGQTPHQAINAACSALANIAEHDTARMLAAVREITLTMTMLKLATMLAMPDTAPETSARLAETVTTLAQTAERTARRAQSVGPTMRTQAAKPPAKTAPSAPRPGAQPPSMQMPTRGASLGSAQPPFNEAPMAGNELSQIMASLQDAFAQMTQSAPATS